MLETKEKKIDGRSVKVTQLSARKSLQLKFKLARILGPVLGALADKGGSIMDADIDLLLAMEKLFSQVNEDTAFPIIMEILKPAFVDDVAIDSEEKFNHAFENDLLFMYKVIGFALEVQFKSFLGGKGIGELIEKVKTLSPSR